MPDHPPSVLSDDSLRILGALRVGVCYGVDEHIAYVNPAFCELVDQPPEQLVGRPMFDIYPPEWRTRAEQYYRSRQRDPGSVQAAFEVTLLRGDGTLQRAEVEPCALPPSRSGRREALLFARDVSPRLQGTALVEALSQVALTVQRARTQAEVMRSATSGMRALGFSSGFGRLDGGDLVVEETQFNEAAAHLVRGVLGSAQVAGRRFRHNPQSPSARAIRERTVVFVDDMRPELLSLAGRLNPGTDLGPVERVATRVGLGRAALCPLYVDGRPWGFLGIASDSLTSADAAGIGLFAAQVATALETAGVIADLEHKNRELAAIQAVARAGSETDFDQLLPPLAEIAASATSSDSSALFLIDHERKVLRLAAAHGGPPGLCERFAAIPLEPGLPDITHMFELQAFEVARLIETFRVPIAGAGFQHMAMVPLHIKGRLAGTVSVARRSERPYTQEELASAERLCSQIAIQVENARLYAEANRRMRQLSVLFDLSRIGTESLETTTLADRVLATVSESLAFGGGAVHLLEEDELVLAGKSGVALRVDLSKIPFDEQTLTGQAAVRRRTVVADRSSWPEKSRFRALPEVRHAIAIPLLSKERLIGVLSLSRDQDRPFDPEELRLLESCAAQVAVSVEHARLFEQERRRVQQLKLFLEVGRMVTGSLDLAAILDASAEALANVTEASNCYIFLLDPSRRYLLGTAASDPAERAAFRNVRLPLASTLVAAEVMQRRAPVRIPEMPLPMGLPETLGARFQHLSVLALPLVVRDEAIGVAIVGDRHRRRDWPEAELERASVLVGQFAVAVANARLYEDLKQSYQKLAHAQEELVRRERLAALGELAAVVAHEVRNPLGVIFNSLGSLRRVLRPSGDAAMLLDIVAEEADRLNRIVGDLLDFARPHDPTLHPEPLGNLVAQAVEGAVALAQANRVTVQTRTEETLPKVSVDARMLRQAILNLIINAVQAMPRGGTVTVAVAGDGGGGAPHACIEVSDTGPGVPPDLADRIFQPFFTTKASGTGLGLAVVKRIVEAHRGEIALTSTPGEGAKFVIRLPMERAAA